MVKRTNKQQPAAAAAAEGGAIAKKKAYLKLGQVLSDMRQRDLSTVCQRSRELFK